VELQDFIIVRTSSEDKHLAFSTAIILKARGQTVHRTSNS